MNSELALSVFLCVLLFNIYKCILIYITDFHIFAVISTYFFKFWPYFVQNFNSPTCYKTT